MLSVMRRWLYVLSAILVASCGSSGADGGGNEKRVDSRCDTADRCLELCDKQTTNDACQRAADKRCAGRMGESCNDVATVHAIFARMLDRMSPAQAARHKVVADEHREKACRYGVATACAPTIVRPPPTTPPDLKNPFARPPPPRRLPAPTNLKIVPRRAIERLRIAGSEKIDPPASVRARMRRSGDRQIITSIKVCIDTTGRVSSQKRLTPTRYYRYEVRLTRLIGQWRFRPYTENGARYPACTIYTFIYTSP